MAWQQTLLSHREATRRVRLTQPSPDAPSRMQTQPKLASQPIQQNQPKPNPPQNATPCRLLLQKTKRLVVITIYLGLLIKIID
jgi:hypothetical protein